MIKEIKYIDNEPLKVEIRNADEHIQKCWVAGAFYETSRNGLLNYIYNAIRKGGKFIDIGASIGNHTLFFASVMKASEVICFEPLGKSYEHLCENIKLNSLYNVRPYNIALGEKQGRCSIKETHPNQQGMAQVVKGNDVEIKRLDDIEGIDGFSYMKIDVEHYNRELLLGAKETLTRNNGVVSIEAESEPQRNEVDDLMKLFGYVRVPRLRLNPTPTYIYIKK